MSEDLSPTASILAGIAPPEPETAPTDEEQPEVETPPTAKVDSEPESDEIAEPEPETAPTAMTVTELAEKLDISVEDLYQDLTLDLRDGETITLGEFKDQAKDLQRANVLLNKAEETKVSGENELLRKGREYKLVAQRLGREPTPEERTEAANLYSQYVERENSNTLDVISDWSDKAVRTEDLKSISTLLSEYGFSAAEQGATVDHRQVKLLRDYDQLRRRLKSAGDAEVRTRRNQPSGKRRKAAARKKTAQDRFKSGELNQNQAILQAIADGAEQ